MKDKLPTYSDFCMMNSEVTLRAGIATGEFWQEMLNPNNLKNLIPLTSISVTSYNCVPSRNPL